jgi:hypothetical protein
MYPGNKYGGTNTPSLTVIENCWFVCNGAKLPYNLYGDSKYYKLRSFLRKDEKNDAFLPDLDAPEGYMYIIKGDC